ncbi:hypothetical protein Ahy_A10g049092 [Arachis hypogaea]|uniref:MEKHLA domain-containing protein n=1 Tax=Arachis hypogaea TaxID=3818 RepID=A0A445B6L7_ARAHY|nr:hypothetical protein Ahy_A10g049092 [Arachis hypogaea]
MTHYNHVDIIVFQGDKKDSVTASQTLDLTSGFEVGPTTNGACDAVSCHSARSVLTIAFQFPFDSNLQDNVAVMACQYIRSVISSVQRVTMAISPSGINPTVSSKLSSGSPEDLTLANWICCKLLRSDSLIGESVLKHLWHHQDAILCCSLKSVPAFIFANQAGLDMLETTLVALQDITWVFRGRQFVNIESKKCRQFGRLTIADTLCLCEPRATTRPCFTVHPPSATVATPAPPLGRHRVAPAIHSSSSIFPFPSPVPIPCFPGSLFISFNLVVRESGLGANILVDNKGCIKLADFGASKQVELKEMELLQFCGGVATLMEHIDS